MIIYSIPDSFILESKISFSPEEFSFWFDDVFCYVEVDLVEEHDWSDSFLSYDDRLWMVAVSKEISHGIAPLTVEKEVYSLMCLNGIFTQEYSVDKMIETFTDVKTVCSDDYGRLYILQD